MAQLDRNLFHTGIYTIPQAARLADVSPAKVRGWVTGYPRTRAEPIIENEVGRVSGKVGLGFMNLMEIRFIKKFSRFGVRVRAIRYMAREAREFLQHKHPFATNVIFRTDGRKIFAEAEKRTGDKALYDLRAKNWAMHEVIVKSLLKGVHYDDRGNPEYWHPMEEIAPLVLVHPRRSFGQPIIEPEGIPTATLYKAFEVEGTYDSVAEWYGINRNHVEQAVRFEMELATA